jgi:hypothetical protein
MRDGHVEPIDLVPHRPTQTASPERHPFASSEFVKELPIGWERRSASFETAAARLPQDEDIS